MSGVLILEDDPAMRDMLRQALTRAGLPFRMATSGARALHLAQDAWPIVMLLDLTIPGNLDGWQVWAALEEQAAGRALNVILFAAELDQSDRDRARQMGACAILHKPVRLDELIAVIHCVVSQHVA